MAFPDAPPDKTPALRLYLIGPMRVTDGRGRKIAIRGRKAQALLALTALGPQMQRSRVWLRDKLWSGSDEVRSSTSLRQSLFELRRDLGELGQDTLEITTSAVSLNPALVWVDRIALGRDAQLFRKLGLGEDSELLEGFDIGDPEFEDWLQAARMDWADTAEELATSRPARLVPLETGTARIPAEPLRIGLMRSVTHGGDELSAHLSDHLVERVIHSVAEMIPLRVLDLRDAAAPVEDLAQSTDAQFFCRMRVLCVGKNVTLTFFLYRAAELTLEWSQSVQCRLEELRDGASAVLMGFISQNVDRVAKSMSDFVMAPGDQPSAQLAGYTALNLLFRLDEQALPHALSILDRARLEAPEGLASRAVFPALKAYATTFAIGENIGTFSAEDRTALRRQVTLELSENPFNAVALTCFGHVLGYVFNEHELAGQVLERAVAQNPAQAFAWDHLALHKLYCGQYDEALRYAHRATQLGAYSPISYSYDTTLAMAATMAGDYGRATVAGLSAVQKQPRFKAALRYLMVAQSAQGRRDEAEQTRDRLLLQDPEFIDPEVRLLRFGLAGPGADHPLLHHLKPLME